MTVYKRPVIYTDINELSKVRDSELTALQSSNAPMRDYGETLTNYRGYSAAMQGVPRRKVEKKSKYGQKGKWKCNQEFHIACRR